MRREGETPHDDAAGGRKDFGPGRGSVLDQVFISVGHNCTSTADTVAQPQTAPEAPRPAAGPGSRHQVSHQVSRPPPHPCPCPRDPSFIRAHPQGPREVQLRRHNPSCSQRQGVTSSRPGGHRLHLASSGRAERTSPAREAEAGACPPCAGPTARSRLGILRSFEKGGAFRELEGGGGVSRPAARQERGGGGGRRTGWLPAVRWPPAPGIPTSGHLPAARAPQPGPGCRPPHRARRRRADPARPCP